MTSLPFPFGPPPPPDPHLQIRDLHDQEPLKMTDLIPVTMHRIEWLLFFGWMDSQINKEDIPMSFRTLRLAIGHAVICNGIEHPKPEVDSDGEAVVSSKQEDEITFGYM